MADRMTATERLREEAKIRALTAACMDEMSAHVLPLLNQAIEDRIESYILVEVAHRVAAEMIGGVIVATAMEGHEAEAAALVVQKVGRTLGRQPWATFRAEARQMTDAESTPAPMVRQ